MRGETDQKSTKIEIDFEKNQSDDQEGFELIPSSSAYGTLGTHAELVWYSFFNGVHAF